MIGFYCITTVLERKVRDWVFQNFFYMFHMKHTVDETRGTCAAGPYNEKTTWKNQAVFSVGNE